jgi:sulfatase modifying factor 1
MRGKLKIAGISLSTAAFLGGVPLLSCKHSTDDSVAGAGGRRDGLGGGSASSGGAASVAIGGTGAVEPINRPSGPIPHPPPGFEDCVHAEVKEDCQSGWCRLPSSCFVMGSPIDEWHRGRNNENQTAVTLTHAVEVQQFEFTRVEWIALTSLSVEGSGECTEDRCPKDNVTWWESILVANILSEREGLDQCYEILGCTRDMGSGRSCQEVARPDASVYECEGYRLPTRAEVEYAARAGTISTFYSGDIAIYGDVECHPDPNLEKIAWYCHNSGDRSHRVGSLEKNAFGLFDTVGNLSEWTNEAQHNRSSPGGEDPMGEVGELPSRIRFGGGYQSVSAVSRTAASVSAAWDVHGPPVGFRLYRTLFEDSERSGPIVEE